MLFTDSDIITAADLTQIDSEVLGVASTSKPAIVVEGVGSICEQAWRECGRSLQAAQQTYTTFWGMPGAAGGGYQVTYGLGTPARNQARARLNQIIASETQYANTASPVQIWMAYSALALFYRDASARMGKDRLEEKYNRYLKDADFSWRQLRQTGLPCIGQPLEAPGAKYRVNAGTWGLANLSHQAGSGTAQTLQVAITFYDSSKYVSEASNGNAESGPSTVLTFTQPGGRVLHVTIDSLNPPAGVMDQVGLSQGAYTPLNATHWVVWVGIGGGSLYFQSAVPIATKSFTLPADPVTSGPILGMGQVPDLNLSFQNMVMRG